MLVAPDNGGSTLLGYDVQMDDGLGGGFVSIAHNSLVTVLKATVTSTSNGI